MTEAVEFELFSDDSNNTTRRNNIKGLPPKLNFKNDENIEDFTQTPLPTPAQKSTDPSVFFTEERINFNVGLPTPKNFGNNRNFKNNNFRHRNNNYNQNNYYNNF